MQFDVRNLVNTWFVFFQMITHCLIFIQDNKKSNSGNSQWQSVQSFWYCFDLWLLIKVFQLSLLNFYFKIVDC